MWDWRNWLAGLLAAVLNGAASAVALVIVDPLNFNIYEGWKKLAMAAGVSGLFAAANYLKQPFHPTKGA